MRMLNPAGRIGKISPLLCAYERIVPPIAYELSERLYNRGSEVFIQKQYGFYSMLPLAEGRVTGVLIADTSSMFSQ